MNIFPIKTFGDVITNQDLDELMRTAGVSALSSADLSPHYMPILAASTATDPGQPGRIWFDQTEQLLKLFVDVVGDTACSVWCAMGPDRYDDVFLAAEPIPPYALLQFAAGLEDRWVERHGLEWYPPRAVAVSVNSVTTASGAWFPACVQGITKGWHATRPTASTYSGATFDSYTVNSWRTPSDSVRGAFGRTAASLGVGTVGVFCGYAMQGSYPNAGEPNVFTDILFFGPRRSNG